ncbi:MAG: polysaccharide biosynthesis tyrosine autokinase [Rhodospirillales bacterium]|nr:polysaccharide biosynthesis tyrosine autokinase [Rhodospirillales bacterium]
MDRPLEEPARERAGVKSSVNAQRWVDNVRDVDAAWLVQTLKRRKWAVIIPTLLATLAAAVLIMLVPSRYSATTEIMLDTAQQQVVNIQAVLTETLPDQEAVDSQVEVLRSRGVAAKVIAALDLADDPEFNPALQSPSWVRSIIASVKAGIQRLKSTVTGHVPQPLPDDIAEAQLRANVIDNFLDRLDVRLKAQSRVLQVTFSSEDPVKAWRITNKLAEIYLLDQLDAKYEAAQRATNWLTEKIANLRRDLGEKEQAVEQYRKEAGLFTGAGGFTLISQQISDLNAQMIVARTSRAEAEARLDQMRRLVRSPAGASAAADVLGSPVIQSLLTQESEVKREVAELADEFGERHPRMISARAALRDVQSKIATEIAKVVQKLENDVGVARAREVSLQESLDQLKARMAQSNSSEVQLRSLERDAAAERTMLETFLSRFEETSAQTDSTVQQSGARIISRADVPDNASYPPRTLIVATVFLLSAVFSMLAVLAIEQFDRGYRSGEQIERILGKRALGLVPVVRASGRGRSMGPESFILKNPSSMFGEAVRSVFTSVLLAPEGEAPKTLLITSAQPNEGKTTLAVCLARMRGLSGRRTVIVETDLRRPSVHRMLGVPRRPGLVELITGEAQLAECLHRDERSGAYVIPAGRLTADPAEILASPQMRAVITALTGEFELVILDSPPVVAVSDPRLLAPQVDATILVVRWAATTRDIVALAAKQIDEGGGNLIGVVLSMVDSKKHAQYGFSDSAYYYGPVKKYYTS